MARLRVRLGTATIGTGAGATSNILAAKELGLVVGLMFYSPAAYTAAISVLVGPKDDSVAAACLPLKIGGVAAVLTAATADFFAVSGFEAVALKTAGTEAAPRDVEVYAIVETH